ncbi:MAG: rhomboid family intramembrane serine protease [Gammaproteobacteria bacterium]
MIPLHDDNPTIVFPFLTITLIATCVLVYLWQISLGPGGSQAIVYSLGLIPAVLLEKLSLPANLALVPAEMTIFTSMFLHGGLFHLAGNMLYLWIFGNNIEDALGRSRFIIFYFLCGIAAAAGQTLQNPDSQIPMIGASGAISGVLGAYLLLYPHARVLVLIPLGFFIQLIRMPASWVLGLWFVMQLISSALSNLEGGGVAFSAHIGGFIAGMVLVPLLKRKNIKFFQKARAPSQWHRRVRRR